MRKDHKSFWAAVGALAAVVSAVAAILVVSSTPNPETPGTSPQPEPAVAVSDFRGTWKNTEPHPIAELLIFPVDETTATVMYYDQSGEELSRQTMTLQDGKLTVIVEKDLFTQYGEIWYESPERIELFVESRQAPSLGGAVGTEHNIFTREGG